MFTRHKTQTITAGLVNYLGPELYETDFAPPIGKKLEDVLKEAKDWLVSNKGNGATFAWDHIYVGEDHTTLYGTHLSDRDTLRGSSGADLIFGESGADTIFTGGGNDVIYGGTEGDTFHVEATGNVTIMDSDPTDRLVWTNNSPVPTG